MALQSNKDLRLLNGTSPSQLCFFDLSFKFVIFYLLISILHSSNTWFLVVVLVDLPEDYS